MGYNGSGKAVWNAKGEKMDRERQPRAVGEILLLGGVEYRIEKVEGYGGSAIVYLASYPDALNQESLHLVYIKELFPYHPKGLVYRNEEGEICCMPKGREYMRQCRQSFYLGNQANLNLLAKMPEQISGNLNSYEAYGTYYSLLPVQGGESLETFLESGHSFCLKEAAGCMKKILNALECFHSGGILHLDISPDNIRIFSSYALLIDYNSVWKIEREPDEICCFSEKEGYTAPEVRLMEAEQIGTSADLYSVCAIFFQILTGRRLSDELTTQRGLSRCFPKNLAIFQGESGEAVSKAVQIVKKGLHILPQKRYQTAAEMIRDFDELLCRIDEQEEILRKQRHLQKIRKGIGILTAAGLILLCISGWIYQRGRPSKKEQEILYAAMQRMEINMGILNGQIYGQEQIVKELSAQEVLDGNLQEEEKLLKSLAHYREKAESEYTGYRDGKEYIGRMEAFTDSEFLDLVGELYQKPEEFQQISDQAARLLEERLCRKESVYDTADKRKALTDAYGEYLKAYTAMCGAWYSQIVYDLQNMHADQAAEEMMDAANELLQLGEHIHYNSQVEISDALTKAKRQLNKAGSEMKRQGLL